MYACDVIATALPPHRRASCDGTRKPMRQRAMHWKKAKACRSIRAGIGAAAEEAAELVWLVFALKLVSHEDKAASAGTTNKKKKGKKTKQKKKQ